MKKRIMAFFVLVFTLLSVSACSANAQKYEYDGMIQHRFFEEDNEQYALLDFVYDDTFLELSDDGSFKISINIILFINSTVDKGTYTVADGIYTFNGFEYGLAASGKATDQGFEIYFSDAESAEVIYTLTFEND